MHTTLLATTTEATTIGIYLVYAVIAVGLVLHLARTLGRNGEVFLKNVFPDEGLATAINQLLVIGFYLLNLGVALLLYRVDETYETTVAAVSELALHLGTLLAVLAVVHLTNVWVFWRIRNHGTNRARVAATRATVQPTPMPGAGWNPNPPAPTAAAATGPMPPANPAG